MGRRGGTTRQLTPPVLSAARRMGPCVRRDDVRRRFCPASAIRLTFPATKGRIMKLHRRQLLELAAAAAAASAFPRFGLADDYPSRPVRIVAGFAAGGG